VILEELCKIKSFGSNMESSVTPQDIADKEAELGFALPQAFKELYLTFHPDDPAFSGKGNLIPFEELKIYKRIYWTDTVITILPFCRHERITLRTLPIKDKTENNILLCSYPKFFPL